MRRAHQDKADISEDADKAEQDQEAQQRPVDSDAVYRRAVAEELIDERRLLLDNLQRRGVLTLDVDAEALTMAVVNRYLQLKARMLA